MFSLHSRSSWTKPAWTVFLRLSGSDHSAIKGTARPFQQIFWRVNESIPVKLCVYDLEESLDMANSRRSLELMATPLSSPCSYKFLSYRMQSRSCSRSCCAAGHRTMFLLLCVRDSQDLVYHLLTSLVCHGHKQFSPLSLSLTQIQYCFFTQEMKYSLLASCFFNISRNKWVWFIGLRIEIDSRWNIGHGKNEFENIIAGWGGAGGKSAQWRLVFWVRTVILLL